MAAYSTTEPPSRNKNGEKMTAYERNKTISLRYPCENLACKMTHKKNNKVIWWKQKTFDQKEQVLKAKLVNQRK